MTRRRWIADRVAGDRAFLSGSNAEHLARVLRARVGQEFEIATGDQVRLGRIAAISDNEVEFELGESVAQAEQGSVSLLLAVFKFDRMEWAIEKATELGVAAIQPVIARRTETHLASAAAKRVERWRRIAHEAAQQARRDAAPEIADPVKLKDALDHSAEIKLVLAESEQGITLKAALELPSTIDHQPSTVRRTPDTVCLAIGPEGGWTDDELRAFTDAGWTSASLGKTILRAETAAIAALAITVALIEP
jgi:16S rRNA (uracil1498-N3)-methyltransferase